MLLPLIAKIQGGRAVAVAGGAAALASLVAVSAMATRCHPLTQKAPAVAWTTGCAERMHEARRELRVVSRQFRHTELRVDEASDATRVQLLLPPQYAATIEYRADSKAPPVFDWEETETPVAGSFALHRHVGKFDLTIVADDSDERGLRFAAALQPLLDDCLMDAQY